jgi:UDP-glucose:glycoprotein glucosyltransferase
MNGFGVELALKRTDYIVIDDRQAGERKEQEKGDTRSAEIELGDDEEVADLKPLSSSELEDLGMKAASYVMSSEYPFRRLLRLTQDFPKYSTFVATHNITEAFVKEHTANREMFLPSGYNVMWINGVQYDARKMDAFSILDHMRRERSLIGNFKNMDFTSAEAIQLLTHPAIAAAQSDGETQRYDWRDESEGGNIIIWMNDIEKDKRYADWPHGLFAVSL